jgi:hypothetical protein
MATCITTTAPSLPVEVWLLVFSEMHDINYLWSTCRNVSRSWRACVDDFFRYCVLRSTFVDLHYSDIHTCRGPLNSHIHILMVFDRISADGTLAVFKLCMYKQIDGCPQKGSVRGWVPFVERYHEETRRGKPKILHKSKASNDPPLWEQLHTHSRDTLSGDLKKHYLFNLGNMTSIGRGDRPPFYIKVFDDVNDSHLSNLVVNCANSEVSFNWRETYALFFREQNFVAKARNRPGKKRAYDKDLVAVSSRYDSNQNPHNHNARARQKRLKPWMARNKHRMSPEMRLITEHRVDAEKIRIQRFLNHENLDLVQQREVDATEELVPERLAKDYPAFLFWPWSNDNGYYPSERSLWNCCTVL